MVVKAVRGRRRYIAFTVNPSLTRETLIPKLRALKDDEAPYVIQCSEGWAVVRSSPEKRDGDIAIMKSADPDSVPLRTSGTLRTLRDRYGVLKRTRLPARK